jgi:hypothetical protein
MNVILDKISEIDDRVTQLQASGGGSVQPAIGFIDLKYKASPRGVNLVPADPSPYPNTFTVFNNTNQALVIQVSGTVSAPHGTWDGKVQGITLQLASQASQDVTISVTAPADAQIGDAATLVAVASVGPPNNLRQPCNLSLTIAAAPGPAVTRSVQFTQTILPSVNTDDVNPSSPPTIVILPYALSVRYSASDAPLTANFKCTVTATVAAGGNVSDWPIDFQGLATANPSPGVFTSPEFQLNSNAGADTVITVRVKTPVARDAAADKIISFTVRIDSTNLPTPITAQTAAPFNIRLRHS